MPAHDLPLQIHEAAACVRRLWPVRPSAGIILGTGLATFTSEVEQDLVINYADLPHFPRATALGHNGRLVCGRVAGTPVVTMEGRFHLYEGYRLDQITFPVRVMQALGIELLIVSNASGGLNPHLAVGDILVLEDHVNLMSANPLVGINDERLGPKYPDMSRPYDPELVARALEIARCEGFAAQAGVYVALCGPNYETRAEYRFLRRIGGDVVGMSTVPEVIVAAQIGLRVLGLSVVTNVCRPDSLNKTDGHSVVQAAESAEPKLRKIVTRILADVAARERQPGAAQTAAAVDSR